MNAGLSPTGARFAAEHADIALVNLSSADPADWRADVKRHRDLARAFGRTTQVWTNTVVLQRDTTEEAAAELEHFMTELLDSEGLEAFMDMLGAGSSLEPRTPVYEATRRRVGYGGGSGVFGSAADVANQLEAMSDAGIDGALLTWADPVDGIRRFVSDVLPLLGRRGLRRPDPDGPSPAW
jgi:alkanesulfonate monooxygenase SsuD/methylene tetrahydromethanopterin reductase-like flavin-dependent oxidoreductase (luciferase family)